MNEIARDGSPLDVYLALPAEPDLTRIRSVMSAGDSVLDLGCGPGRIANPLAAAGHPVVAVDDSSVMLTHVVKAETAVSDIWTLHLRRRFDAVLALSHLINSPLRSRRIELLRVCRDHVARDGLVVVQRYPPDWAPMASEGTIGDVSVRLLDVVTTGDASFHATVTYTVGGRMWSQYFEAAVVGDDEMASLADANDLKMDGTIDGDPGWVVLSRR